MRLVAFFFWFLFLFGWSVNGATGQSWADPTHYLIDSLDLSQLHPKERALIDTSLSEYHAATSDTARIRAINTIVEGSWNEDVWPRYNQWVHARVDQLLKSNPAPGEELFLRRARADALNNFGYYAQNHQGNLERALDYFHQALRIRHQTGDSLSTASLYNNIATILKTQGDHPRALELHQKALRTFEHAGNQHGVAYQFSNISMIHSGLGNFEEALNYQRQALRIRVQIDDRDGMATSNVNLGHLHSSLQDLDSALFYHQRGLELYRELGHKRGIGVALNNVAGSYEKSGDVDRAESYYQQSLQTREASGDVRGMGLTLRNLGRLAYKRGDLAKARKDGERSMELAREVGSPKLIQHAAGLLSEVAAKEGKYQEAFEMHTLEVTMRDSLANKEVLRKTAQLEARYQYEKKSAEDKATIAQQDLEIARRNNQMTLLILGLALVLLIAGFFYQRWRWSRVRHELAERKKQMDLSLVISDNKVRHEFDRQLLDRLENLRKLDGDGLRKSFSQFILDLRQQLNFEEKLDHFSENLDSLHGEFEANLKARFPELTAGEIEICHMFRLNMSIKEIANLKKTSEGAIRTARYRIKSKLGVKEGSLDEFIKERI